MGDRGAFDLHTVPGVLRAGLLAGLVWGLLWMVVARATESSRLGRAAAPATAAAPGRTPPFLFPLEGISRDTVAEGFDARRGGRRHEAVDVPAPRGTRVRAAADGKVRLTRHEGAGLTVEQDEASSRYCLVYAHLDRYPLGLVDGAEVARGQTIGFVGTTGNAPPNVPHLHFAVHLREGGGCWSGAPVDPQPLFGE